MVKRITIYGWIVPQDRIRGPGSGSLVDLVYFVDDEVSISDVINIIVRAGYKIIPKRFGNRLDEDVESDKVIIEEWDSNIKNLKVGSEKVEPTEYDRYSYPTTGL